MGKIGSTAWGVFCAVVCAGGCDGGLPVPSPDAAGLSADASPAGGLPADGGNHDSAGPRPRSPGALLPPGLRRLVPGGFDLLGLHQSGCSHGSQSLEAGGVWCAFGRPAASGRTELWVLDLTAAMNANVPCDGASPACVRLTDQLFDSTPQTGGVVYPTSHRFYGDILIYYGQGATGPDQLYQGPVYAWRPGWPAGRMIAERGVTCAGHVRADVASCIANISPEGTEPVTWDLHAGPVNRGPLGRVAQIHPVHPRTMASAWRAGFSPDGAHFAYSTRGPSGEEPETLFLVATADIGSVAPAPIGQPGISRWSFSADGSRWFYLRDYNYDVNGSHSGTLVTQTFPNGPTRTLGSSRISPGPSQGVAFFQVLRDEAGADAGLAIMQGVSDGRGDHLLVRNPQGDLEDPVNVAEIAVGTGRMPAYSPDLRYAVTAAPGSDTGLGILHLDGSGRTCTLTTNPDATLLDSAFSAGSGLVFWTENLLQRTQAVAGWVASPSDCSNGKRRFAEDFDFAFLGGDDWLVYSDQSDGQLVTVSHAPIEEGARLGRSNEILKQARRLFWVLTHPRAVIVKVAGAHPDIDGVYLRAFP